MRYLTAKERRELDAKAEAERAQSRKHHYLKTVQPYFDAQARGEKPFEVRRNDRAFLVGDILHLQGFVPPDTYTGRELLREVTYILDDTEYCKEGFVVLGTRGW